MYRVLICLKVVCYFQWLNSSNKMSFMRFVVLWFNLLIANSNLYVDHANTIICCVVSRDLSELMLLQGISSSQTLTSML